MNPDLPPRRDDPKTDAELLEAWRAGDAHGGQQLFGRHFTRISRFFRSKVDERFVDERVQETFGACVRSHGRLRNPRAFRSYLFGVAYDTLREHYRRRAGGVDLDFNALSVYDLAASANDRIAPQARRQALHEGLRHLPVDQQVAVELHYWEGMTTPEIAAAMSVPEGTAQTRIRRGKLRLPELMRASAQHLSPPR